MNPRPQRPERCALARLRYSPIESDLLYTVSAGMKRGHQAVDGDVGRGEELPSAHGSGGPGAKLEMEHGDPAVKALGEAA